MIHFDFQGSVVDGQVGPHHNSSPLFTFRVQFPCEVEVTLPVLNGHQLQPIAAVTNRVRGQNTSRTMEFEVREPGTLEITSFMDLKGQAVTMVFGVYRDENAVHVQEPRPSPFQWFVDGDFVEADERGQRVVSAIIEAQAAPSSLSEEDAVLEDNWDRLRRSGDAL